MSGASTSEAALLAASRALNRYVDTMLDAVKRTAVRLSAAEAEAEAAVRQRRAAVQAARARVSAARHPREEAAARAELARAEAELRSAEQARARVLAARSGHDAAARALRSVLSDLQGLGETRLIRLREALRAYAGAQRSATSTAGRAEIAVLGGVLPWLPVAQMDFHDNPIEGAFGRGGATLDDYRWAVETLVSVVEPGLRAGMGRGHFARQDSLLQARPFRRVADVYDLFFSGDAVALSPRPGGGYDVLSGRHRIAVARELGIHELPARVVR